MIILIFPKSLITIVSLQILPIFLIILNNLLNTIYIRKYIILIIRVKNWFFLNLFAFLILKFKKLKLRYQH